jgi:hypothetical protein
VGYDLHITRRRDWSGTGRDIRVEEWLAYVDNDPELSLSPEDGPSFARWSRNSEHTDPWLDWFHGNIYTKNPGEALIEKMVGIARVLGARVQGDDGEIYQSGYAPPIQPKASVLDHLRNRLPALRPTPPIKEIELPFQVGDRVLDVYGKETTVVEIDSKSNHGLGKVKVRYDDGRELSLMLRSSGLRSLKGEKRNE